MGDKHYRRYTYLTALIQLLTDRQLTLLDPSSWDDKNDSYFLSKYKEKKKLKSVLALCLTCESETYHQWRVFSSGSSGVCIHFSGTALKKVLRKVSSVRFKGVTYLKVDQLCKKRPTIAELPFIKRFPYKHEKEYRALWVTKDTVCHTLNVHIGLSAITRITLSPWLNPNLHKSVVSALKRIDGCKSIPMWGLTLTENANWKEYGASAT
jgi:hypothetical protein